METSRKSTMKSWTVRNVRRGKRQLLGIICPHCECRALVARDWASYDYTKYRTRSCTYCFKASWLPGEHPDEKTPGLASDSKRA